jgi:3-oxoacyl-[acyl-carrier protein] reductase
MSLHVIVTGASRGLGRAIASELARGGAKLLLVGRDRNGLRETAAQLSAPCADLLPLDLRNPGAAETIVMRARSIWPRLDGLVNNAGVLGPAGAHHQTGRESWEAAFQVNLFAPADLCRRVHGWMKEGGGASIVNIGGGGAASPRPLFGAYAASKAALVRLSENLAAEWAGDGIRVNCVAPGAMETAMLRQALEGGEPAPLTLADPREAARLTAFLLGPAAAAISGRLISAVWDDWRSLEARGAELAGSDIFTLRRITPEDRRKNRSGENRSK